MADIVGLPADLMKAYRDVLNADLGFVWESKNMRQIMEQVASISASNLSVTVTGPVGAGKCVVARAIHLSGSCWWRPFFETDLAGLDRESAEKFLFGYKETKLFTGSGYKEGLLFEAENSTLCFRNFERASKEVHMLVFDLLKNGTYLHVGGKTEKRLNTKLIFTLSHSPASLARNGILNNELSEKLGKKLIEILPLSKRKDDIVPLAEKFLRDISLELAQAKRTLSKDAERWLKKAPWNGNVSQLKKAVYTACINTSDAVLEPKHFALMHDGNLKSFQDQQMNELSLQAMVEAKVGSFLGRLGGFEPDDIHDAIISRVEEPLIKMVLDHADGNQIKASRMLGINRNTLRAKIRKYEIKMGSDGE